ncbi:MAG: PD-(D/E)XK nuclease family protein [Elusimicrobiota bacterium]
MTYKRTEYPEWSWSSSRKSAFDECKRRYYFNYYLAHNGWEEVSSDESRLAYRLKKLTGLHLVLGTGVHEAAEYVCRKKSPNNEIPSESELEQIVRKTLRTAWIDSRDNREKWKKNPGKYNMLHEFYYKGKPSDDTVRKINEKIRVSVPNILKSASISELYSDDCILRITEEMDTFEIFDTPVYAIPDLVYERADGTWVVVDWKTGKEDAGHASQINVYCMYIKEKYGVDESKIKARIEYLITGNSRDISITAKSQEASKKEIYDSITKMKETLDDPDINKPKKKEEYPLVKSERFCPWCNFYEMCRSELNGERL